MNILAVFFLQPPCSPTVAEQHSQVAMTIITADGVSSYFSFISYLPRVLFLYLELFLIFLFVLLSAGFNCRLLIFFSQEELWQGGRGGRPRWAAGQDAEGDSLWPVGQQLLSVWGFWAHFRRLLFTCKLRICKLSRFELWCQSITKSITPVRLIQKSQTFPEN